MKRKILKGLLSMSLILSMLLAPAEAVFAGESEAKSGEPEIEYSVHIKDEGDLPAVRYGMIGGHGRGLWMEEITVSLKNAPADSYVRLRVHMAEFGWGPYSSKNGEPAGSRGQSTPIECVEASLQGSISKTHDLYYRVHAAELGNLAFVKNGEKTGSEGCSLPLEGIEFVLKKKTEQGPATSSKLGYFKRPKLSATVHIAEIGDVYCKEDANGVLTIGTEGRSLAIEGVDLNLSDILTGSQAIKQRLHLADFGWESSLTTGFSGSRGQSRRAEAIEVALFGYISKVYDIVLQAHVEGYGWMPEYTKNSAGTVGKGLRLEALRIKLVKKNTGNYKSGGVIEDGESSVEGTVLARLNEIANRTVGTTFTSNGYKGNYQCNGYAKQVFEEMFGSLVGPYNYTYYQIPNPNANVVGVLSSSQMSLNSAKALLLKAKPGDFIQTHRRGKSYGHSMIVLSVDVKGVEILDANSDGKNTIRRYFETYEVFYSKNDAMTLLSAYQYK